MSRTLRAAALAVLLAAAVSAGAQPPDRSPLAGGEFTHAVRPGESWTSLGARFGVEPVILAALNGRLPRDPLRAGDTIRVDSRHLIPAGRPDGITINIPQRMLFLIRDGALAGAYPVGLGLRSWPTFTGPFTVERKETDPVWDVPPSIQAEMRQQGKTVVTHVAAGPGNPLGKYWLGLSVPGYGIHGTVAPLSIFRFQSHGCIRLHNEDIERLFNQVEEGTPGETIYEPVLLRVDGADIWLEAHRDVYGRVHDPLARLVALAATLGVADDVDWEVVRQILNLRDGQPHLVQLDDKTR